jgi:hypothetical protein
MAEYKERTETVDVPKNTGVEGFMATVRKILSLPRIQVININAVGHIKYTRIVREEDDTVPLEVDFSTISPAGIIRNNELVEMEEDNNPTHAVARMFEQIAQEHLFPVAWVSGPGSTFWLWHERAKLKMSPSKDQAYGLPFLYDENFPSSTLVLCTGYTRMSAMIDVKKSFKMLMPEAHNLLKRES